MMEAKVCPENHIGPELSKDVATVVGHETVGLRRRTEKTSRRKFSALEDQVNVFGLSERGKRRRHDTRRTLALFILVELADWIYDLIVYANFVQNARFNFHGAYNSVYLVATILGTIFLWYLVITQLQVIRKITAELKGKNYHLSTKDAVETKRLRLVRSFADVSEEKPEFQLGEAKDQMRRIRAGIFCCVFEDIVNLLLVCYRVWFGNNGGVSSSTLAVDPIDQLALLFGSAIVSYKLSYVRDHRNAEKLVKRLTNQLLEEARVCSSVLDDFGDVSPDEINKVVAVRQMLGRDLDSHPPHVGSDVNLLRFLRDNAHDVSQTVECVRKMLKFRIEHDMDKICHEIVRKNMKFSELPFYDVFVNANCICDFDLGPHVVSRHRVYVAFNTSSVNEGVISFLDYKQYLLYTCEFILIANDAFSVEEKKMIGLIKLADLKNLSMSVGWKNQEYNRLCTDVADGLGVTKHVEQLHFFNIPPTFEKLYNLFSHLLPGRMKTRNRVWGGDLTKLIQAVPNFADHERRSPSDSPRILGVTGTYYLLSIFGDVTKLEMQTLGLLEKSLPGAFADIGPLRVLRFLREDKGDVRLATERLRKTMEWRKANKIDQMRQSLVDGRFSLSNPPADVQEYFDLLGFAWANIGSPRRRGFIVHLSSIVKVDVKKIKELKVEEFVRMHIKQSELVQLSLDEFAIQDRQLGFIRSLNNVRGWSLSHSQIINYFAAQSKVNDAHYPNTVAKPILMYGLANSVTSMWEMAKVLMPQSLAIQSEMVPANPAGIAIIANYIDLAMLPEGFLGSNVSNPSSLPENVK